MAREIFAKDPKKYIPALAEALKNLPEFEVPSWAYFVKSGVSKERAPVDENFWFTRSASILRQLYLHGVVGVGRLRTRYGSRKDRGGKRAKFFKASGKIIRLILQQAENAGLVEKVNKFQHGRRLTQKGRDFLDGVVIEEEEMPKTDEFTFEKEEIQQEVQEEANEDVETKVEEEKDGE